MKKFFVGLAMLSMTVLLTACNSGEKAATPAAGEATVTVTPDAAVKTDAKADEAAKADVKVDATKTDAKTDAKAK